VAGARRSVEKEAFWRRVLDRQRRSGLSVRGFCLREGVSVASFYSWRRKIFERDAQRGEAANSRPQGLVPVEVISGEAISPSRPMTGASNTLEIITPEGLTLRFDARTRPETVAVLVDVITQGRVGRASC